MSDGESSISGEDACSSDDSFCVSRLITEEDLIDSLFYTCDIEKSGRVPVSRLIEYLKFTTSSINDSENELVHLASLLDPDRNDSTVDITTYRAGIRKWIEDIRNRNEDWYDIDDVLLQNSMVPYRQTVSGNNSLSCSYVQGMSLMNSNLENSGVGDGSNRSSDLEPELVHRISDLQHTNKVLTAENSKLQQQIDILEESISSGTSEMEKLRTKINCLQGNIAWKQELQQENEDLKESVNKLQERKKFIENRINILEKENNRLDKQSSEFEKKVCQLTSELENSEYQNQQLIFNLGDTKCMLTKIQEDKIAQDAEFCRKVAELGELKRITNDLTQKHEELKEQNDELQMQLNTAEQELENYHNKIDKCVGWANDNFSPDDGKHFLVSSTPMKHQSICFELQETMGFDEKLPSPLNEKEMSHLGLTDLEEFLQCSPTSVTVNDDTSEDLSHFVEKLKDKPEGFLSQLETFVQLVKKESAAENCEQLEPSILQTNITDLSEKVTSLSKSKQLSDVWLSSLMNKIKQDQEEATHLQEHVVSKKMVSECSDDMDTLGVGIQADGRETDHELSALKVEIEMKSLTIEKMLEVEKSLKQEAETLRMANIDLTDRCHKADVKSSELQDEISKVIETLKAERQKFADLEENSAAGKVARSLDLQEIWRLIQSEFEKECGGDQIIEPSCSSIDLLKEQISKDISTLKTKLIKKQAALGALHSKPRLRPLPLKSHCYCEHTGNYDKDPCGNSPLVEALTIDFLGTTNTFNCVNKSCATSHSECSKLSEKCQYPHCNGQVHGQSNAQSCPSLDQKFQPVSATTQTDAGSGVNISQTNLATSSSSSTSGAFDLDFCSTSSHSIDGRNKRKDFLRSCLRFESDSQTSQSIESNTTDTDTSQVRQRSQSYKAAVEGHCNNTEDVDSFNFKRNHSFSTAVENTASFLEGSGCTRSRSLSFQTAIESGQHTPTDVHIDFFSASDDVTPENPCLQDIYWKDVTETKNVYFDLRTNDFEANNDMIEDGTDNTVMNCTMLGLSRAQIANAGAADKRSPNHIRKLSTLVEEDFSEGNIERLSSYYRSPIHVQPSPPSGRNTPPPPYARSPRKQETENSMTKIDSFQDLARDRGQFSPAMHASSQSPRTSAKSPNKSASPLAFTESQNKDHVITSHNERLKASLLSKSFSIHTEDDALLDKAETPVIDCKPSSKDSLSPDVTGKALQDCTLKSGATVTGLSDKQRLCESTGPHIMDELKKPDMKTEAVTNGQTTAVNQPKLSKLREDNLARKREQMRHMTMPGLAELAETDTPTDKPPTSHPVQPIVITNGDVVLPPPPSDESVFPSIPDEFLQKLGLLADMTLDKVSPEQLTENEIEHKFASLSLAFRTDKQTLEKRVDIQERARDIAEKNVDKELQGIRTAIETLNSLCHDHQHQDVLQKIQHHLDIIQHTTARISCRAEVFGAVQQEKRMSRAVEIMVHHVENVKRTYEREHSELEETRRLLQDARPYGASLDPSDVSVTRRSTSVCANNITTRGARRRVSDVALPKLLGGGGSTGNLTNLAQLDPKTRFQVAVASTTVKNMVTDTFRRASLEKQSSISSTKSISREGSQELKNVGREKSPSKQNSQDDEAFHKGFEQGYRAHLGQQLTDLRINQSQISQSLENMMDKCEEPEEEEKTLKVLLKEKVRSFFPHWEMASAKKTARSTMAGLIFFMAILSFVILFLFPVGSASLEVRAEYRHMGNPPL